MINQRRSLTDSIRDNWDGPQTWADAWENTEAAVHLVPLPTGVYVATACGGELGEARSGTPRYRVTFEINEGEHAGRRLSHDVYLTPKALPLAKRDLAPLGINHAKDMEQPLRPVRVLLRVVLHNGDDGTGFNLVRGFERMTAADIFHGTPTAQPVPETVSNAAPCAVPPMPTGTTARALYDDAFAPYSEGAPRE